MLYGMPTYPVDESKYVLGGHIVGEETPKYHYLNCDVLIP